MPWTIATLLQPLVGQPLAYIVGKPLASTAGNEPYDMLRSTSTLSLPARLAELDAKINPFLARLNAMKPPTTAELSDNYRTSMPKMIALRDVARKIAADGSMEFAEAAKLFHDRRAAFTDDLRSIFPRIKVEAPEELQPSQLRAQIFGRLPLLKIPWRATGQSGRAPALLLPNVPSVSDEDLAAYLKPIRLLLDAQDAAQVPGEQLSQERLRLIHDAMPSFASPFVDYVILKAAGSGVAERLGISRHRQENISARIDQLCSVQLPELMDKAHGVTLERASRTAHGSTARAAVLHCYRGLVTEAGVLKDATKATHAAALYQQYPELLDVVRAAVRANTDSAVIYKQGETPVDELLIRHGMRGAGKVRQRVQHILNGVFADRNMRFSESTAQTLLKHAGAKSLKVLHNYDAPKAGKHYCSADIVTDCDLAFLFSAYMPRLSIDQKANLKCNTDANAGNEIQITSERVLTYSHGAGGDHLAKFGCFSMLVCSCFFLWGWTQTLAPHMLHLLVLDVSR